MLNYYLLLLLIVGDVYLYLLYRSYSGITLL